MNAEGGAWENPSATPRRTANKALRVYASGGGGEGGVKGGTDGSGAEGGWGEGKGGEHKGKEKIRKNKNEILKEKK